MISVDKLYEEISPEDAEQYINKLTTAFKNNQLIDWDSGKLASPFEYKGFVLTHVPIINLDNVSKFLGLGLSSTNLSDMTQYTIRHMYLRVVLQNIILDMYNTTNQIQSCVQYLSNNTSPDNIVFNVIIGDPQDNDTLQFQLSSSISNEDNLKAKILEKIPMSSFKSFITGINVDKEIVYLSIKLPKEIVAEIMYPIIEEFFGMTVTQRYTDTELRVLGYKQTVLADIVKRACSNCTILAYRFGTKLFEISDLNYRLNK